MLRTYYIMAKFSRRANTFLITATLNPIPPKNYIKCRPIQAETRLEALYKAVPEAIAEDYFKKADPLVL